MKFAWKEKKWIDYLKKFDHKTNPKLLWKTIKSLNGAETNAENVAIKFGKKFFNSPADIGERFNKQFTTMETHSSTPAHRKVIQIKSQSLKTVDPFCSADLDLVIQETKNSPVLGPDGLSKMHLKHIGPAAKEFLLFTFNLSIARSKIPSMWKKSLIIPVSKPGKPANEA